MKTIFKSFFLSIIVIILSCSGTKDDSSKTCNGNCNIFKGRIYREDNIGLANVEVKVVYRLNQIGANYTRIIAKNFTDSNGNFQIEGFIKDSEFKGGIFILQADEPKIESLLTNEFYKLSELVSVSGIQSNEYIISNLTNRNQITTIDYKVPYKTNLIVQLNNYSPISTNDYFGVGNIIKYGFQSDFNIFYTKVSNSGFGYANSFNTTINLPSVNGENSIRIIKSINNSSTSTDQIVNLTSSNQEITFTY